MQYVREAPKLVKNAVVSLTRKGILETSKNFDALTARSEERCKMERRRDLGRESVAIVGRPWMSKTGDAVERQRERWDDGHSARRRVMAAETW
jgi:hypothetical protein